MAKKRIILKYPLKLVRAFLFLAVLVSLPFVVSLLVGADEDYTALEPFIVNSMKQNKVPGLSLVIFKEQNIVYSKGFGVKNTDTGEPVDETTVFEAASLSKPLTAYAALILVERGKLALDEPLNHYLKKRYLPDQKYAGQITLRMVLNHTSGLSNDSDGKDRKIYFAPGGYFSYSGAGFRYLQTVIETVSGLPFAEFMDREIFKPLGMNSSSYIYKDEMAPLIANGHEAGKVFPIEKMDANAAYSLLSTPADMARFNLEICQPKLLKPETVALMLTPSVKWVNNIYWGLGIGLLKTSGEDFFWHWGNNYYYCSMMITGKDSKTGAVIMTNGNTGMFLAERLAVKITNQYFLKSGKDLDRETFDLIL